MSAIFGYIQSNHEGRAVSHCAKMQAALAPYGSQLQGIYSDKHAAIGSRLQVILPEDIYDHQPVHSQNSRFILVADVRLDNRDELAHALGISPYTAKTLADADFLLAAYEKWREKCPEYLIGDFAFAVWDTVEKRLFLARDQLGVKPLFYCQTQDSFAFSTMPPGLFDLPGLNKTLDFQSLRNLAFVIRDFEMNNSYFEDIKKILPAHAAIISLDGNWRTWRYWDLSVSDRLTLNSDAAYQEAFLEHVNTAVRCRLRSIGGVASQLSGGFDSATVTTIAARQLADQNKTLHAYTSVPELDWVSEDRRHISNEFPYAAQIAGLFPNIVHKAVSTREMKIIPFMNDFQEKACIPGMNITNSMWIRKISDSAVSDGTKVLLTGEFGNFTISYNGSHIYDECIRDKNYFQFLANICKNTKSTSARSKIRLAIEILFPYLPEFLQSNLNQYIREKHFLADYTYGLSPIAMQDKKFLKYVTTQGRYSNFTRRWLDSRTWRRAFAFGHNLAEFNKYLTVSGIEKRDPTSDIRLLEFLQKIPVSQFNQNQEKSLLLKTTLKNYWPNDYIINRIKGLQAEDTFQRILNERDEIEKILGYFNKNSKYKDIIDQNLLMNDIKSTRNFTLSKTFRELRFIRRLAIINFVNKNNEFN